jgi:acetylornithine/succinyldiaminopimelate/putrescine aminotransferase
LYGEIPFNDSEATRERIRAAGDALAAVVFEPVILAPPDAEWLAVLREETARVGAVLVVDEIKTVCRLALGGGSERYGIRPDLVVMGKAMANGYPLAAVGGRADVMDAVRRTWISSTLATEWVSVAASIATLRVIDEEGLMENARSMGERFMGGLGSLVADGLATEIRGRGLMIGVETAGPFAKAAVAIARDDHRLLVNATGETTLRLVPPLTISAEEVDEAIARLRAALTTAAAA